MLLGVLKKVLAIFDNWTVSSVDSFTETEGANNNLLLLGVHPTNPTGIVRSTTTNINQFGTSSITFKLTNDNNITSNPTNAGLINYAYAHCYDSSNNYLGYVCFLITLYSTGQNVFAAYLVRDFGSYASVDRKSALGITTFDPSDQYVLSVDVSAKTWSVTRNGANSQDGNALLGALHANTAYIKYAVQLYTGAQVVGTSGMNVISIS